MSYALALYQSLERSDPKAAMTKFRSSAAVDRDVKSFKEQIGSVKTTDELFKNRRLMSFVLTAYGLETELNFMGRMKGVLMSDLTNPASTANILKDSRYREIAGDLRMFKTGLDTIKSTATVDKVVERYVAAQYELSISKDAPALREARYFAKNIGKVTNVYEILGDNVLRKVVTATLGLPEQIAIQPIETQAELIKRRLDLKQFQTAAAGAAAAADLRTNAQADVTAIEGASRAITAAAGQTAEMATRIRTTLARYDALPALQDPAGANAPTIAVHAAAVPALVRIEGVAATAETALGRVADDLNRLSTLRRLAADPVNAASFAAYKTEFATLADRIRQEIGTGADYRSEGQDYNLLDGSLDGNLVATVNVAGASATLRRQDLSGFVAEIDAAAAAFAAANGAGDAALIAAAGAAISRGGPMLGTARDALIADRTAIQTRIDSVPDFLAAMDTGALRRASVSITDSDTRLRDIAAKLTELRGIANQSIGRIDGADRSDLVAQAQTVMDAIDALVATPGADADDLLGADGVDYALTAGRNVTLRGRDIADKLDDALGSGNVHNANTARDLVAAIDAVAIPGIQRARDDLRSDRKVINLASHVLDARGKVDERARSLVNEVPGIVSRAAVGTTNLLNTAQRPLILKLKSAAATLTVEPELRFRQDMTAKLTAAAGQLPANLSGAGGALALLGEAAAIADASNARLNDIRSRTDRQLLDARRRLQQAPPTPTGDAAAQPTEFTKRFVQRYLGLADMKTAGAAGGGLANAPGGALLALFA